MRPLNDRLFSRNLPAKSRIVTPGSPDGRHSSGGGGEDVLGVLPEGSRAPTCGAPVIRRSGHAPCRLNPELKLALARPAVAEPGRLFAPGSGHVVQSSRLGWAASGWPSRAQIRSGGQAITPICPSTLEHYASVLEPFALELPKPPTTRPSSTSALHGDLGLRKLSQRGIQHTASGSGAFDTETVPAELRHPACRRTLWGSTPT